jgi:hypothetical protein
LLLQRLLHFGFMSFGGRRRSFPSLEFLFNAESPPPLTIFFPYRPD